MEPKINTGDGNESEREPTSTLMSVCGVVRVRVCCRERIGGVGHLGQTTIHYSVYSASINSSQRSGLVHARS